MGTPTDAACTAALSTSKSKPSSKPVFDSQDHFHLLALQTKQHDFHNAFYHAHELHSGYRAQAHLQGRLWHTESRRLLSHWLFSIPSTGRAATLSIALPSMGRESASPSWEAGSSSVRSPLRTSSSSPRAAVAMKPTAGAPTWSHPPWRHRSEAHCKGSGCPVWIFTCFTVMTRLH